MKASESTPANTGTQQTAPAAETRRMAPRVERFPAVKPKFTNEQFGSGEASAQDGTTMGEGVPLSEGAP